MTRISIRKQKPPYAGNMPSPASLTRFVIQCDYRRAGELANLHVGPPHPTPPLLFGVTKPQSEPRHRARHITERRPRTLISRFEAEDVNNLKLT